MTGDEFYNGHFGFGNDLHIARDIFSAEKLGQIIQYLPFLAILHCA